MIDEMVDEICDTLGVTPRLDLFASSSWHVCPRFVSLLYTPRCVAAHALAVDWRALIDPGEFAWVFPPGDTSLKSSS
jgi:hypothetical protein